MVTRRSSLTPASTAPIVLMTQIERAVDRGDPDVLRIYKNKARLVAGLLTLGGAMGRMSRNSVSAATRMFAAVNRCCAWLSRREGISHKFLSQGLRLERGEEARAGA